MNYQEFRAFRDRKTSQKNLLRLDCMNPAKALRQEFKIDTGKASAANIAEVASQWRSLVLGPTLGVQGRTVLFDGVRRAVESLFAECARLKRQAWIPVGVYPEYWAIAERHKIDAARYGAFPALDLEFLKRTDASAWTILPYPLIPEGRLLTSAEISRLAAWLQEADRVLFLDCAYALDLPLSPLAPLWDTGRAVLLHSLSKGWLSPGVLGVAHLPVALSDMRSESPEGLNLSKAASLLSEQPLMPRRMEDTLRKRWERLSPVIRSQFPHWSPPETGYFSILPISSAELLTRYGWLAIPGTVFGADRERASVITCLFYGEHDPLP